MLTVVFFAISERGRRGALCLTATPSLTIEEKDEAPEGSSSRRGSSVANNENELKEIQEEKSDDKVFVENEVSSSFIMYIYIYIFVRSELISACEITVSSFGSKYLFVTANFAVDGPNDM